jgi:hypothetical protein
MTEPARYGGPYGRLRELGDMLRTAVREAGPGRDPEALRKWGVAARVSAERSKEVRRLRSEGFPAHAIQRAFSSERTDPATRGRTRRR